MKTMLVLIVDKSGSMYTIAREMEQGINELVKEQNDGSHIVVRLTEFASYSHVVENNVRIENVKPYKLKAGGLTMLNDTILEEIDAVKKYITKMGKPRRPKLVMFHICTDGHDNMSSIGSSDKVKSKIAEMSELGWKFEFIGAQGFTDAGNNFGIDQVHSYDKNKAKGVYGAASQKLTRMRSQSAAGLPVDTSYTQEEIGMFS